MKVWVVIISGYDEWQLIGVFDSKDKAEAAKIALIKAVPRYGRRSYLFDICEQEINDDLAPINDGENIIV